MRRRDGSERVTAPVDPLAVIWFAVPASEVTPVLVTLPFAYARPLENVVVATQVGVEPLRART